MRRLRDSLWIGPAVAATFASLICTAAYVIGTRWDADVIVSISEDTLVTVLALFASSMLTVATFSLSAITASASSVAASTTPRAAVHVITDARGHWALASFVAAFVYSVVGILSLVALRFGELGRLLLFAGLIVVVVLVLVAFIAWVDHVLKLGRQQHALDRLLRNALVSMTPDAAYAFGALAWDGTVPEGATPVVHPEVGRAVTIDTAVMQRIAEEHDVHVVVTVRPGDTVEPTSPVLHVVGDGADQVVDECGTELASAIGVGRQRTQDQDVRFNVTLLAETADRALSPAVNDPGTAIVVLDLLLELFVEWHALRREAVGAEARARRVRVPVLTADELVRDAFGPIARDGAPIVEVGVRLQKVLTVLQHLGDRELADAAGTMSRVALDFADRALVMPAQRSMLEAARR